MGKKEKKVWALHDEFKAMINLLPKLKELLSVQKEIAEGYQKYRKTGGASIPGLEKHLGIKEPEKASSGKAEKTATTKVTKESKATKEPKEIKATKKTKQEKTKEKLKSVAPINDAGAIT